jgi:resuscitation-promoting factor RpfB
MNKKTSSISELFSRDILPPKKTRKSPKQGLWRRLLDRELHKHPFAVPVITIVILSFITMFLFVVLGGRSVDTNDSHVVQLSADGKRSVVPTKALTVKDFLDRSKVKLKEGDVVEPALDTEIDADDFRINVYRAKPITILDNGKRIQALSAATTPRAIAAQAGIQVHAEDRIIQANPKDVLKNQVLGTELVIERATPVNLNLYGTPVTIRTHADTVGELLKEKNVSIAGDDTVLPANNTPITPNIQVFITRVGTKIETATEEIPNEQQIVEDATLSFGTTALRQAGSPGKKLVTYQIELKNSQEIGRKIIQEVRILEPVPRITARGKAVSIPADKSQIMAAAGIKQSDYPYVQYIINHENASWCPTRWQGQNYCPQYYAEKFPGAESDPQTGYGLCQSTPANKMSTFGADWRTNVVTQMRWCDNYATSRYGSWEAAYNFWTRNRWW